MKKFISLMTTLACVFACLLVVSTASAQPSPFEDQYDRPPPPRATTTPANPPPGGSASTPPKPTGGGVRPSTPPAPPPTDCPFGETVATAGKPSVCATADEWIMKQRSEAEIEGAKNARYWGWGISIFLCLLFAVSGFGMYFSFIRKRLNRIAGVIVKKFDPRVTKLEERVLELETQLAALNSPSKKP